MQWRDRRKGGERQKKRGRETEERDREKRH
jgi:hypothetical protein